MSRDLKHRRMVLLLLASWLHSSWVMAIEPRVPRPARVEAVDIRLDAQGTMHGVVVNGQGRRQVDEQVVIVRSGDAKPSHTLQTDRAGKFACPKLRAGSYRLVTSEGVCLCRVWTETAAPPNAAPSVLIVNDSRIERGQRPIQELFYSDPLLMATVVAAAIAIPIAVHKARDDRPDGS